MVEFTNCRLTMQLEPQSVLVHFQAAQQGATVRASEMKPKLDRFLLKKLQKQTGLTREALKKHPEYGSLFWEGNKMFSFRYRMQVTAKECSDPFPLEDYRLVKFANRSKRDKYYGLVCCIQLTIHCFIEPLRQLITQYIEEFFLVNNFGYRNGRGFGSFLPTSLGLLQELSLADEKQIAALLLAEAGGHGECYCMRFPGLDSDADFCTIEGRSYQMEEEIADFYLTMRTGQNGPDGYDHSYLFTYMHQRGIDNEKAWMKEKGLVPALQNPMRENVKRSPVQNPRFLKVMLGGSFNSNYWDKLVETKNRRGERVYAPSFRQEDRITVSIQNIADKREKINIVPSPIRFKIVRNVVFIVACPIPRQVYGAEFEFSGRNGKRDRLWEPSASEFDIQDFLNHFVEYYNGELRQKLSNIADNKPVKKAGEADA